MQADKKKMLGAGAKVSKAYVPAFACVMKRR